jgi:hypothetical protein
MTASSISSSGALGLSSAPGVRSPPLTALACARTFACRRHFWRSLPVRATQARRVSARDRSLTASSPQEEERRRFHVFNTFFYKRLTSGKKGESVLPLVKRWTDRAGVDIFAKDFLIIPINE